MIKYLKINPSDNVAVALQAMSAGETIIADGKAITLNADVPMGHKIALTDIDAGSNVIKYGYPIGHTVAAIKKGDNVNEKTLKTNLEGLLNYNYSPIDVNVEIPDRMLTFKGYKRANGTVGVRNEIWIIPSVGCVNGTAGALAERLRAETGSAGVDAIVAFPHNYGCSQLGGDHENTRSILRNMLLHPNAGGALVIGLGCENNQISAFKKFLGEYDEQRIRFIETQNVEDEYESGMQLLREIYGIVSCDRREDIPLSALKVGLKCGGSDGLSGITANPLLGAFSDFLIAQGGSAVLTEVPEMFGAETLLMNRCVDIETFNKTVSLINDFKDYFIKNEQPVYENPSPGNKQGGISTLEEKSLGCTQKSGRQPVQDILKYGERIKIGGLNLLSAPGNDLVASTALASAGCHIVLFTTGRGTPFGTFVPTMKISTNTTLYLRKPAWIDFNAGTLAESETMSSVLEHFIEYIIDVISGRQVNNEKKNYREIAIFKSGVTL